MSERRTPSIAAYENGPFLVRGPIEILDERGEAVETHRGTVALCRCGHSSIRPLCDGSHASGRARPDPSG
jgi:CDGSH-type Zn-finger protein